MTTEMPITGCPAIDHAHATLGQLVTAAPYCRMGQDYDCTCRYCSPATAARYTAKIEAYNTATAEHRAHVAQVTSAFLHLAAIGKAIRAAAAPARGIARMARDAAALFVSTLGNLKGAHFKIVGKRGSAKAHVGKVGVCRWIGEGSSYGPYGPVPQFRGGWRPDRRIRTTAPTIRVGLEIAGESKWIYVAHSQLERLPTPATEVRARLETAIVRAAIAPLRTKLEIAMTKRGKPKAGQIAHVVEGRDAGASGVVFWCGADKVTGDAGARLGLKTEDGRTVWASAYHCAATPMQSVSYEERREIERVAADAVEAGRPDQAKEILSQLRVAAGGQ